LTRARKQSEGDIPWSLLLQSHHTSQDVFRAMDLQEEDNDDPNNDFFHGEVKDDGFVSQRKLRSSLLLGSNTIDDHFYYAYYLYEMMVDIVYYGPSVNRIFYNTWTPPLPWAEASRYLIPRDSMRMPLQRLLSLRVGGTIDPIHSSKTPLNASDESYVNIATLRISEATTDTSAAPNSIHLDDELRNFPTTASHTSRVLRESAIPSIEFPLALCHIHVRPPVEMGVLEVYVRDAPRREWMEHTFSSASEAAQFQVDLIALQFLGPRIHHMYQAFRIIHQGSIAHVGTEPVLHHFSEGSSPSGTLIDQANDVKSVEGDRVDASEGFSSGIAWDDVMRCLGSSFPAIRQRLELLWWRRKMTPVNPRTAGRKLRDDNTNSISNPSANQGHHGSRGLIVNSEINEKTRQHGNGTDEDVQAYTIGALRPKYRYKRALLGPVDFFRLFVPLLPESAVPKFDSRPERFEQLLRWRKRVARASVLVRAYVQARKVVNHGWIISRPLIEKDLTIRMAYDRNVDNLLHDANAKNEVYEASVSRDILCRVRGFDSLPRKTSFWNRFFRGPVSGNPTYSGHQGYTHVGTQIFQTPDDPDHPLNRGEDPVHVFPSIMKIIQDNPDVHFFIACFCHSKRGYVDLALYARCLPVGVDTKFDRVVSVKQNLRLELSLSFLGSCSFLLERFKRLWKGTLVCEVGSSKYCYSWDLTDTVFPFLLGSCFACLFL
jgi:hypothetical protein